MLLAVFAEVPRSQCEGAGAGRCLRHMNLQKCIFSLQSETAAAAAEATKGLDGSEHRGRGQLEGAKCVTSPKTA